MITRNINGATVKVVRELLGISQRDLAARCDITQGHLSNLERGLYKGSAPLARLLADNLGCPLEAITYPAVADPGTESSHDLAVPVASAH